MRAVFFQPSVLVPYAFQESISDIQLFIGGSRRERLKAELNAYNINTISVAKLNAYNINTITVDAKVFI